MNKLLYNETIKHINRSVIQSTDYNCYYPDDMTLCAQNPVSNTRVYFTKNSMPKLSYNVTFSGLYDNPFTAAESEQLFNYAENRYNDHFKDADMNKIILYKGLLISNNMTRNR
ncbi:MAG: hypothetical protein K2M34_01325 [Alphaproteobacteria bacterium]|nr:hypothetical protein [Alphaproteobacteria bacterium]